MSVSFRETLLGPSSAERGMERRREKKTKKEAGEKEGKT